MQQVQAHKESKGKRASRQRLCDTFCCKFDSKREPAHPALTAGRGGRRRNAKDLVICYKPRALINPVYVMLACLPQVTQKA